MSKILKTNISAYYRRPSSEFNC